MSLLRKEGRLHGFRMELKNVSKEPFKISYFPGSPSEAAGLYLSLFEGVDVFSEDIESSSVPYPMHHPTIRQKLLAPVVLDIGGKIVVEGTFEDFFTKGYTSIRTDRGLVVIDRADSSYKPYRFDQKKRYTIGFRTNLSFEWKGLTWSESARRSGGIHSKITTSKRFVFDDVPVLKK